MEKMYFVNEQHELNFASVLMMHPNARTNVEYRSACYILAVPMIFEKVEYYIDDFKSPVGWMLRYLEWQEDFKDEWKGDREERHPDHEAWIDRKPYDLSNSMIQLGKLALNLWTGYDDFNLMRCLASLDKDNVHVARCAIDVRLGLIR
ncbi:hypothetical protein CHH61_03460 [Shouchella clausii]|uniref:Uncharacterized protein n=2 Tax=Shouchella clausii TaxID=79880 RepID=A0A268S4G7_SHOCL|nr:hypothetical protein CHH61_03460 [Shouchella clausii]